MLLRLCQLKSRYLIALLLITTASCSSKKDDDASELLSTFPNAWFSANSDHSLVNAEGVPVPHLLFDTTPELNIKQQTVNVVITVPEGSDHSYAVDFSSGQPYYTHSFCSQADVWGKYSGMLYRPDFSVGYIPRVLDQVGEPQKVIVWSNNDKFVKYVRTNYERVKLVGAYVEQNCPEGNCLGKSNWLSRMVFLAVDAEDKELSKINTIEEFKEHIDWEKSKAQLENMDGRNSISDRMYPARRIGQLIPFSEAFDYFKKRSVFLTDTELKRIQKGCHALYDKLWEEAGKERPEDKPARTLEELKAKVKLHDEMKEKRKPVGFAERFADFTEKYYDEITTCDKFVYHGNINKDRERFWLLSYVGVFYRLHKEGYFYSCKTKSWQRNVLNADGNPIYDIKKEINECSDKELDLAMKYLPNFLAGLKDEKTYFRFVDYDNHIFGTHSKLYSWVKAKPRKFACSNDPNVKVRKKLNVFPEDIFWKSKDVKDIEDEMKIIF